MSVSDALSSGESSTYAGKSWLLTNRHDSFSYFQSGGVRERDIRHKDGTQYMCPFISFRSLKSLKKVEIGHDFWPVSNRPCQLR